MFRPGFNISQVISQGIDLGKSPGDYINPQTGKKYTFDNLVQIIGDFINDYDKGVVKKSTDLKEKLNKDMPTFSKFKSNLPESSVYKEFQIASQHFIRNIPLEFKLEYFNKIQNECPFIIADPLMRKKDGQVTYGLADVYRFIGLPLNKVKIGKYKPNKPLYRPKVMPVYTDVYGKLQTNPLYAPVSYAYPIPDVQGNMALQQIYMNNPLSLFSKLKKMYSGLIQIRGGAGSFDKVNDAMNKFYIKGNIKDMVSLINYLLKKELDPFYLTNTLLSRSIEGNQIFDPPMRNYFKKNINSMLFQLLMSHRLYKIDQKPATNKLQVTSPMMQEFMTSYKQYGHKPMVMVQSRYKPIGPVKSSHKGPQKRRRRRRKSRRSRRSRK